MPRSPRIHLSGVPQHVIQRGVDRQPVFFSDDDCSFYLDWLTTYSQKRGILLHAYCLMTNHIHLVLTASTAAGLGGLMQDMGRRYVQYINRTYRRSGGLWQGRYKASHIQTDRYLLTCQRYVELNPVRSEMVKAPGEYRWSSYRANALGEANPLITPHSEYLSLASTPEKRHVAYRALFVSEGDNPDWMLIRVATQQGVIAGDSRFAEAIGKRLERTVLPRPRGRPRKELSKLTNNG